MSLPQGLILDISVDCDSWQDALPDYDDIIQGAVEIIVKNVTQGKALTKFAHLEMGIVLCDDSYLHKLNNEYRGQDKPTNVLSFEGLDEQQRAEFLENDGEIPEHPFSLGEVYVAYETMVREADAASLTLRDHFIHLIIHGILHLLGYDHIEDDEPQVMEGLETRLLSYLGIDDPYAP